MSGAPPSPYRLLISVALPAAMVVALGVGACSDEKQDRKNILRNSVQKKLAGRVHFAQLSAYIYVRVKPSIPAEVLVQQRMAWDTEYRGVFVVRKDSPFKSIKSLNGKRFAYVDETDVIPRRRDRRRLRLEQGRTGQVAQLLPRGPRKIQS